MACSCEGVVSKNEEQFLQFNGKMSWQSTHNVVNFFSNPEDSTHDGPRTFKKISGDNNTQVSLIAPFKFEFGAQQRMLMEARLKKVSIQLITGMPINTVSMWLWESTGLLVPGTRKKFICDFPVPSAPGDQVFWPGPSTLVPEPGFRLKKDRFYYWCWEFDDLIARTTNFGIQVTSEIWFGNVNDLG